MAGMVTRRRLSPRLNPGDTVPSATTTTRKTRNSKKSSAEDSKKVEKNNNVTERSSRRLRNKSEKLRSTKDVSDSKKENKLQPSEPTKKFFKYTNPKSDKEDMYVKNISSIIQHGLSKPLTQPTGRPRGRPKKKEIKKANDSSSFQLPVKESSSNQVVTRKLRSRQKVKDYGEESQLITKFLTPRDRGSIVLVQKLKDETAQKNPVYKRLKMQEDSIKNESDIYDFKFDDNDSKEKLVKKKRRRIVKKPGTKTVRKNKNVKSVPQEELVTDNAKPSLNKDQAKIEDIHRVDVHTEDIHTADVHTEDIHTTDIHTENIHAVDIHSEVTVKTNSEPVFERDVNENLPDNGETITDVKNDTSVQAEDTPKELSENDISQKPTIIAIENLSGKTVKIVNPLGVKSEKHKTYQPPNVTNRRTTLYKNMMEDTLLNKSMSPIGKAPINFDPSSPWRAPSIYTFSQVKNLFQSTPRVNKINGLANKAATPKKIQKIERNKEMDSLDKSNNENSSVLNEQNRLKKNSATSSTRKFGTEITNVDKLNKSNTLQSIKTNALRSVENNLPAPIITENNKPTEPVTPRTQTVDFTHDTHVTDVSSFNDIVEDKENTVPNFQTPKKKSPKKKITVLSPFRSGNISNLSFDKENTIDDPQPGPSGLQTYKVRDEQKILRQSNLNNFLNITEMPESTRISTKHGIFDDAHSTPISGKTMKKVQTNEPNIENAFGFSDNDDSDLEISSIKPEEALNEIKKLEVKTQKQTQPSIAVPARLPVETLKTHFLPKSKPVRQKKQPNLTVENLKQKEDLTEPKKIPIDVVSFSDTFDVLSETGEVSKEIADPPLFADLEPSHFTKPPRHSYKRKRNVRFSFSEEESEGAETEDDEHLQAHERKRRKVGKLNKQDEKRLEEWVKNVNHTFEEIDHYDLVVE